ncbi:MAG: proline--tRNA ligase [Deltaproteobacteria bacterium]|nr:proline--tRNA ligase [Deltaproteobacteria bacterium]
MTKQSLHAISPTREENYPEWYLQVVKAAELADNAPVRGCMVIRPWGYAIWELMKNGLDKMIKDTGHVNACFPLLIPLSFLEKEAEHVEGFAKECAVVTHHRLESSGDGKGTLVPAGKLEEPYVIRPTSETIIGHSYAKWIQSWRDLPILINQWANVMRWEMRPRLFLRTSEFFWQEGHTAHETEKEAIEETLKMLDVYEEFTRDWLALPVVTGRKTPDERFPGAVETWCIEAMMQDGKALQAGTSHFLGQNFAKASDITFLDREGETQHAWTTSWGVTTRLIGGLIMTHSDDDGLVLPPRVAPEQIVILPIGRNEEDRQRVLEACQQLKSSLQEQQFMGEKLRVAIDARELRGGEKFWYHVKRGVPLRIEIGPRDLEQGLVCLGRRDRPSREKVTMSHAELMTSASVMLKEIQTGLLSRALAFRQQHTRKIDSVEEFREFFSSTAEGSSVQGGFALCHWNEAAIDHPLLKELKVSPRCIPVAGQLPEAEDGEGRCFLTGKPSLQRIVFAKSY